MLSRKTGSSVVQFALVFPMFALFGFLSLEVVFLGLRQARLERVCTAAARELAASKRVSLEELNGAAQDFVNKAGLENVDVRVDLRALPTRPVSAHQDRRPVSVVEVNMSQAMPVRFPFSKMFAGPEAIQLRSRIREVRW